MNVTPISDIKAYILKQIRVRVELSFLTTGISTNVEAFDS